MNENKKGILRTLAVAACVSALSLTAMLGVGIKASHALSDSDFRIPFDRNRNPAPGLEWVGLSVTSYTAAGTALTNSSIVPGTTTSGKLWASQPGVLRQVFISTGASTVFVTCYDTGTVAGAGINPDDNLTAVRLIQPHFANTTNATCAMSGGAGGGCPPLDIEFRRGLWCYSSNELGVRYFPVFRLRGD